MWTGCYLAQSSDILEMLTVLMLLPFQSFPSDKKGLHVQFLSAFLLFLSSHSNTSESRANMCFYGLSHLLIVWPNIPWKLVKYRFVSYREVQVSSTLGKIVSRTFLNSSLIPWSSILERRNWVHPVCVRCFLYRLPFGSWAGYRYKILSRKSWKWRKP